MYTSNDVVMRRVRKMKKVDDEGWEVSRIMIARVVMLTID